MVAVHYPIYISYAQEVDSSLRDHCSMIKQARTHSYHGNSDCHLQFYLGYVIMQGN